MKWNWGTGIAASYVLFAAATVGFVIFAMRHTVALVRPDYYAASQREDQQIAARERARRLEPAVSITESGNRVISLSVPPHQAGTARGTILLYRASDPAADRTFPLALQPDGTQQVRVEALAAGHWIVKLHWTAAGRDYDVEQPLVLR